MGTFLIKRLAHMVPVILLISVLSFIIINLPPGDYLTIRIIELEARGDLDARLRLEAMRGRYGLDKSIVEQYFIWASNFARGDFGYSFAHEREVRDVIGDRLLLTVILSIFTLVFVWVVAIPIGIYSARHQYSAGDNIFTFLGFIGLATPNFLLALIMMYVALVYFGTSPGGLFSPEYQVAPWSIGRVIDMLSKMWIPVVILGTSGTAGLLRIMRGNLLNTLGEPFVQVARAKGLHERVVVYKHAVRVAINPLITIAGMTLPGIISGEAIVAIILNLPTLGPLFLNALLEQDMYLAGTILIMMSVLLLIGNLIADIALVAADPRIRVS